MDEVPALQNEIDALREIARILERIGSYRGAGLRSLLLL